MMSIRAQSMEGMDKIRGLFFLDANSSYAEKYSELSWDPEKPNIMLITVTMVSADGGVSVETYRFDIDMGGLELEEQPVQEEGI